jgi:hypothetical protein
MLSKTQRVLTAMSVWLIAVGSVNVPVAAATEELESQTRVEKRRDEAQAVGDALSSLNTLVPTWQIPAVVADPVAAGDFEAAAETASAAQDWIEFAYAAQEDLPQIDAMDRIRDDFENAGSLDELRAGARLAEEWAEAANHVSNAITAAAKPRGLLAQFGLWGVNVQPTLDEALAAAIAGDVPTAINKSGEVISVINSGSSSGSLRLAGLVFFGVAVLGLWYIFQRRAGPPAPGTGGPPWAAAG